MNSSSSVLQRPCTREERSSRNEVILYPPIVHILLTGIRNVKKRLSKLSVTLVGKGGRGGVVGERSVYSKIGTWAPLTFVLSERCKRSI
jgi:hypothetical protein